MVITSFRELTVWQKSFNLAIDIYELASLLPKSEQYGLISQITRCAVSIPSNIAEGQQRHGIKEYRQFIGISQGSAAELKTQLLIIERVYGLDIQKQLGIILEIQKMLYSLSKKLEPKT